MGGRAVRVTLGALALCAVLLGLSGCTPMDGRVTAREAAQAAPGPRPTTLPTSAYDGKAPPRPDRRPVEQNPSCWIASPGWPRCSELERTDTR
jgi:hypothetical protein